MSHELDQLELRDHDAVILRALSAKSRRVLDQAREGCLLVDTGTGGVTAVDPTPARKPRRSDKRVERTRALVDSQANGVAMEQLLALNNRLVTLEHELAKKNAMLERASRAKDRVLSMVAHDLRSPLNAIVLNISYLERELDEAMTSAQAQVLSRVGTSAEFMKRLIDDLVDVASLASGKPSSVRRRIDIAPLLREALILHEGPSSECDVTFELSIPESLPIVEADPDRLHQILANLLSNAVGHTPAGGRVTLEARTLDGFIEVGITDQGPGVAPGDAARIFEPYARGTQARRSGGSLGLGLAISRALVAAHGGEIGFRNLPEGGARFRFSLPVAESAVESEEAMGD